ncbi:cytochrome P450 [Salinimicrobium sp. GXAS 041]|uniref:cytochrome P450 n=1 Tax=Salinimicrobium sp. GXAS 041 TaxID=3400806 RepID=UPI003C717173
MESTLGIACAGYPYFLKKFRKQQKDIYKTRILLKKAIVMKGEDAAKLFYDTEYFQRKGAAPKRLQKTLFGVDGVQGLDGEAHRHRKKLFMEFMGGDSLDKLQELFIKHWKVSIPGWKKAKSIVLFSEAEKILCKAACEWAGVPLPEEDVEKRTRQMDLLIASAAAVGPKHSRGRKAREEAEEWLAKLVTEIRGNRLQISEDSIIYKFSTGQGNFLNARIVAVELLNLIRPVVAISRYIVFAAVALHENPEYRQKLKRDDGKLLQNFVQEVRRFYPFFPFVAAKVRKKFRFKDVTFPKGRRVLLDLYATNHDERIWEKPGVFSPERFNGWKKDPFDFIPQGGGDHHKNHRCAGEWITINITKTALALLLAKMDYTVPKQNVKIDLSKMPALPASGFKIKKIKLIP